LLQTQGFLSWIDGDFPGLQVSARRLLAVSQDFGLPDQEALARYFLGVVHVTRNELEAARDELTAAFTARFNLRLLWWCQAAGALALTHQALGQPEQAQETLSQAHDFILERHAIRVLPNLGAFQAELDRRQGSLAEASAWAAQVEPAPLTWSLEALDPRLVQARVFLSQERDSGTEHAAALLAELRAFCHRVPNRRLLTEVEALEVLLLERRGEHEAALELLQRLVLAAEATSWVRLFVDLGEPMAQLLAKLASRRVAPHAIGRILDAFPARQGAATLGQQSGMAEPLSTRELQILTLLEERNSNKEIAAQLYIAPSTVKRHTLSIYRKLGINDRREAVARATELGLLHA
jgi:LuxR family maltose regulon positive regulatory protein